MRATNKSWYLKGTLLEWFEQTDNAAELSRIFTLYGIYESGINLELFDLSQEDKETLEKMKSLPHHHKAKLFEGIMIKEYNDIPKEEQSAKEAIKGDVNYNKSQEKLKDEESIKKETFEKSESDINIKNIKLNIKENQEESNSDDTEDNFFNTAPK